MRISKARDATPKQEPVKDAMAEEKTPEAKVEGITPHIQPPLELKPAAREETELLEGKPTRLGSYVFSIDGNTVTAALDSTRVSEAIGGAIIIRMKGVTGFFFKTDETSSGDVKTPTNEGDL